MHKGNINNSKTPMKDPTKPMILLKLSYKNIVATPYITKYMKFLLI